MWKRMKMGLKYTKYDHMKLETSKKMWTCKNMVTVKMRNTGQMSACERLKIWKMSTSYNNTTEEM